MSHNDSIEGFLKKDVQRCSWRVKQPKIEINAINETDFSEDSSCD